MFGRIAGVYDLLNHILSLGIDRSWRRELANIMPSGSLLDLAAGTLDVSIALAKTKPESRILAIDFCFPMLAKGIRKTQNSSIEASIMPVAGDATSLPLPDACMDGISIAFGIRNIPMRQQAYAEMLRVLKPGGKACILEFGSAAERILGGVYNVYLAMLLPSIGRVIAGDKTAYSYLSRTIREFPSAKTLENEMRQAGFINTGFKKLTGGIVCLHWGENSRKHTEQKEKDQSSNQGSNAQGA